MAITSQDLAGLPFRVQILAEAWYTDSMAATAP